MPLFETSPSGQVHAFIANTIALLLTRSYSPLEFVITLIFDLLDSSVVTERMKVALRIVLEFLSSDSGFDVIHERYSSERASSFELILNSIDNFDFSSLESNNAALWSLVRGFINIFRCRYDRYDLTNMYDVCTVIQRSFDRMMKITYDRKVYYFKDGKLVLTTSSDVSRSYAVDIVDDNEANSVLSSIHPS